MSISTSYYFNQAVTQMGDLQTSISKTQMQLSTGQQLTKPSDDAVKTTAIGRLNSSIARQDSYTSTLNTVGDRLQSQETTIKSANDSMTRMKELAIQAANGTLSAADRSNIAVEMSSLRDGLISIASTQDINGNYLFSGTKTGQQPFAGTNTNAPEYVGDQSTIKVFIGDQREMKANRPGNEVFTGVLRQSNGQDVKVGFFRVIDDLVSSVRNSDQSGIQRGLGELDQTSAGLTHAQSQIGADLNLVDNQKSLVAETKLQLQTTLSSLADCDYTKTATDLQKAMLGLQAIQSSFARTADLNLFNYLK